MQIQEEVLRTGYSYFLQARQRGDGKHEVPDRTQARPPARSWDAAASPSLSSVFLWSLAITCAQIFRTRHMQWHVSCAHVITVIVTAAVVIVMQTIN